MNDQMCTASGQTDTKSGKASTTSEQMFGQTSMKSGQTSTTRE